MGKLLGGICLISIVYAVITGRVDLLTPAVLDGATGAVKLTLSLCGTMCLWCGIMEVFRSAGTIKTLSHLLAPVLKLIFPDAVCSGCATDELAANISANILGIGNAATPYAIEAMKKLKVRSEQQGFEGDVAGNDMVTLAVLNTSSISLIPTTVGALRRAAGSERPFSMIGAVWISSFFCSFLAVVLSRMMGRVLPAKKR